MKTFFKKFTHENRVSKLCGQKNVSIRYLLFGYYLLENVCVKNSGKDL